MKTPKKQRDEIRTIVIQDDAMGTEAITVNVPKRLVWAAYALGVKPGGLAEWLCADALSRISEIQIGEIAAKLGTDQGGIVNVLMLKRDSLQEDRMAA